MDIDEFYESDPRRQASDEIEFGREWTEDGARFEVAWIADTGEVYAMAEPSGRSKVTTEAVTVEVLAVVEGRQEITTALAGWKDVMDTPNSLAWVRERVDAASSAK
jgi:hypothetical protein